MFRRNQPPTASTIPSPQSVLSGARAVAQREAERNQREFDAWLNNRLIPAVNKALRDVANGHTRRYSFNHIKLDKYGYTKVSISFGAAHKGQVFVSTFSDYVASRLCRVYRDAHYQVEDVTYPPRRQLNLGILHSIYIWPDEVVLRKK